MDIVAKVASVFPDFVTVLTRVKDVSDFSIISRKTPGFEIIKGCQPGTKVNVSVDIIPPRTSTRTHIVVEKVISIA